LISLTPYIVHVGYVLMFCAFLARDVLWLRGLLVIAQTMIVIYAARVGVPSIAAWNVVFAAINATWAVLILRERRAVTLPAELQPLHARHFAALTPPEFLRFWKQGRRDVVADQRIVHAGGYPDALFFLLAGTARVSRNGSSITDLPAGFFVAEMSLLTGNPANADVDAVGSVEVMRWNVTDLRALQRNAALWTKVQSVIGHDLVQKIQRSEAPKG
jgi:hypothetical protein